jgi:hypothetical protein
MIEKNDGVGYGISEARSAVNPVTLVQSRRKLLPDLKDDDLQGFLMKKSTSLNFLTWCVL